jgi:urease accessory protein
VLDTGWQAQLRLSFLRDGARTELGRREHSGPLRVQRAFYPEGEEVCHVYVLHPPGGLVGGDRIALDVQVLAGAHALLTTPAAGKLYRSSGEGPRTLQSQRFAVAAGGKLEWLPQENIAFEGAHAQLQTRVELAPDACFIGWEVLCLGRPAANEAFTRGELRPSLELVRDGHTVFIERGRYTGGSPALQAAWGMRAQPVTGSFVCAVAGAHDWVERARSLLPTLPEPALAAVSGWDNLLVARYLGPSAEQARELFATLWVLLRPALLGRDASPPRIWRT